MRRTAIPTVTPTMVGTFEEWEDDRSAAAFDEAGCEDRDDWVIVGLWELVGDITPIRQDILDPVWT